MTRTGSSKPADRGAADGRLGKARLFHKAARNLLDLLEPGDGADGIISSIALAAVAYADALTARFGGVLNQKDHSSVVKLLRAALRAQLPATQEARLARLLSRKDEAQYGAASMRRGDAEKLLADLEKFAGWAEEPLSAPRR